MTSTAKADWALNMPKGVTDMSLETYNIHMMVLWWCVAIGVIVFGVMIFSLIKHRKSTGVEAAKFSHNTTAEVIWTTIPVIILVLISLPTADSLVKLEVSREPDVSIVVTG